MCTLEFVLCTTIDGSVAKMFVQTGIAVSVLREALCLPAIRQFHLSLKWLKTIFATEPVKLKNGDVFPGMKVSQDTTTAQYYGLSKTPPELRKFAPTDLESKTDNSTWHHPQAVGGHTTAQLADIVSYIRWAAAGDKKPVNPGDVE
jgi:hypothetical protein